MAEPMTGPDERLEEVDDQPTRETSPLLQDSAEFEESGDVFGLLAEAHDGPPVEPTVPLPAAAAEAPVHESEVECPGCGLRLVGEGTPRPTAAWFCPQCDYPLFWATDPPPPEPGSSAARRRLPGTGGRLVLGAEPCWHCGEMSEPDVPECRRCAATLPKPDAPKVHVDVPVPVPVPVSVRPVLWPWIASAACSAAAIAAAVASWAQGG